MSHRHQTLTRFGLNVRRRREAIGLSQEALKQNVARDRLVTRTLRKAGWRVVRIWECQLTRKKQSRVLRRLQTVLSAPRH